MKWVATLRIGAALLISAGALRADETDIPAGPVLYVVSVGVAQYNDSSLNLQFCDRDAQEFSRALGQQSESLYTVVRETVLTNRQASADNVIQAMSTVTRRADNDDTVVFFFSGHGGQDDSAGFYLATVEANAQDLGNSTLAWTSMESVLRQLRVRHLLVFLDACQAGSAVGRSLGADKVASSLSDQVNTMFFCSSRGNEDSVELPKQRHGAFTAALLDGLRPRGARAQADANDDGRITLGEMREYLPARVKSITKGAQNPTRPSLGGCDPDTVLVLVPTLTTT